MCAPHAGRTVVVYEVGDRDTEQSTVQASVETNNTLAVNDLLGRSQGASVCLLLLDLGTSRQSDQRVAMGMSSASDSSQSSDARWSLTSKPWTRDRRQHQPAHERHCRSVAQSRWLAQPVFVLAVSRSVDRSWLISLVGFLSPTFSAMLISNWAYRAGIT